MSAIRGKADITVPLAMSAFDPKADIAALRPISSSMLFTIQSLGVNDRRAKRAAKQQKRDVGRRRSRNAPKSAQRRNSTVADKETNVARLASERDEAREQLAATSEVLQVISSSPGELEPVFQAMLEKAVRICDANFGNLFLREGDAFRIGATYGASPAYVEFVRAESCSI